MGGIDAAGHFASKNHVALKRADGHTIEEKQLECDTTTPDGEWRKIKIRFDIEENKCDVKVDGKKYIDDCKFEGITIPHKVCVGVCAGANAENFAHICVNDLTLLDQDEDHDEHTGRVGDDINGDEIEEENEDDCE